MNANIDLDNPATLQRNGHFGFGDYNRSAKSNLDFLDFTKSEEFPSVKKIVEKYETNSQAIRDKYFTQADAIKGFTSADTKKKNDILAQAEIELKNERDRFQKEYDNEVKELRKAGVKIALEDSQVYIKRGLDATKTILSTLGIEAPKKETTIPFKLSNIDQQQEDEKGSSKVIWWVLGGVALLGLGFFAYKKFSKQQ
jgi:hypothetical protein